MRTKACYTHYATKCECVANLVNLNMHALFVSLYILPSRRINIILAQKTWPGKGHESPKFIALFLVIRVVYMRRRLLQ